GEGVRSNARMRSLIPVKSLHENSVTRSHAGLIFSASANFSSSVILRNSFISIPSPWEPGRPARLLAFDEVHRSIHTQGNRDCRNRRSSPRSERDPHPQAQFHGTGGKSPSRQPKLVLR